MLGQNVAAVHPRLCLNCTRASLLDIWPERSRFSAVCSKTAYVDSAAAAIFGARLVRLLSSPSINTFLRDTPELPFSAIDREFKYLAERKVTKSSRARLGVEVWHHSRRGPYTRTDLHTAPHSD
jgi:hypothetical protein